MADQPTVDIKPLDVDGVGAIVVGTAAWAVALVVLFLMRGRLQESGAEWWIWVALAGFLLGFPGLWYTTRRRSAYRRVGTGSDA